MNPAHTYLVRYRPHPDFGWTGCHTCATLQDAERFAAELTADGEMIEQVIEKVEGEGIEMEDIEFKPFSLGSIVATPGVIEAVPEYRLFECLVLHKNGDWGKVCVEDEANNNLATQKGYRILSAYPIDPTMSCKGYGENCLWIITESDRSATTFLLPEEY